MIAACAAASTVMFLAILVFQIALACGKPWGEYAWGGQNKGVLPKPYRIGSVFSALILLSFATINLAAGGFIELPFSGSTLKTLQWIVTGYSALGTVMNAISRSRPERYLWTPIVFVLATLNAIILHSMYPS